MKIVRIRLSIEHNQVKVKVKVKMGNISSFVAKQTVNVQILNLGTSYVDYIKHVCSSGSYIIMFMNIFTLE